MLNGGPLSPLLANIMLDDLDKLLEERGHKFCRYADDCNIYVRSQRAGERVMSTVRRFIEGRLLERFKARVREITARSNGWSMEHRIRRLHAYLRGWLQYFRLAKTPSVYRDLDGWALCRLRLCLWKHPGTRLRELRALQLPEWVCLEFAMSRKGYWSGLHEASLGLRSSSVLNSMTRRIPDGTYGAVGGRRP